MLKLSSSRGIRINVPVMSVSWSFEGHSVIIQALRKGLIEHEASDTGGVPRWESSCSDRLAEATGHSALREIKVEFDYISRSSWWGCRQLGGFCLFLAAVVLLLCRFESVVHGDTAHQQCLTKRPQ